MIEYTNTLTTREWATVSLVIICFLGLMSFSPTRKPLIKGIGDIARKINKHIITAFSLYFLTSTAITLLLWHINFWNPLLLKETIIIVCVGFLPFFVIGATAKNSKEQIIESFKKVAGFSALLAIYLNLVSFNFWMELILQIAFVILWLVMKSSTLEAAITKPVTTFSRVVRFIILLPLAIWTLKTIVDNWNAQTGEIIIAKIGLNIWIPLLLIVFIYFYAYVIQTSSLFPRAPYVLQKKLTNSEKLAFFIGLEFSITLSYNVVGNWNFLRDKNGFRNMLKGVRRYVRAYKFDDDRINLRSH